jgi:hypothetical protein
MHHASIIIQTTRKMLFDDLAEELQIVQLDNKLYVMGGCNRTVGIVENIMSNSGAPIVLRTVIKTEMDKL